MLLLRFSDSFLLRFDARAFLGLLFQEPPRSSGLVPIGAIIADLPRSETFPAMQWHAVQ
jgi:hypothetical protein